MIIGDGAIANRFASYDLQSDYLVFAAVAQSVVIHTSFALVVVGFF